jgi:hypothetical protein
MNAVDTDRRRFLLLFALTGRRLQRLPFDPSSPA